MLEPQRGVFDDSALASALATIRAYNDRYPATPVVGKLRIFQGKGAPAWLIQSAGGPITVTDTSAAGTRQTGAFWNAAFRAEWQTLQAHLAAAYDSNPLIGEVAISSCSSQTAEPFIIALDAPSRAAMRQFGFNDAALQACLSGAKDDYAAWTATPLDFTFNPYRNSDGCSPTATTEGCLVPNPQFSIQIMDAFRSALGPTRAVVANHGLQSLLDAATIPLYAEFLRLYTLGQGQTPPTLSPLEFQTINPTVDWDSSMQLAFTYHPTEIEIWDTKEAGRVAPLTMSQLRFYSQQLALVNLPPSPVSFLSSASYYPGPIASFSFATLFVAGAAPNPAPGSMTITDSQGASRPATLVYDSPSQMNALLPVGLAPGKASFMVTRQGSVPAAGTFTVAPVAPGLFTANGTGTGVAAAYTVTQHSDETTSTALVFSCSTSCAATPINLGQPGDTVYLILFGTGIRNRSSQTNTSVSFGSQTATPLYAGLQGTIDGLDQVNVVIPRSLAGSAKVYLTLAADGVVSNGVTIQVQ